MKKILSVLFTLFSFSLLAQAPIKLTSIEQSPDTGMTVITKDTLGKKLQRYAQPRWLETVLPYRSVSIDADNHNFIISNGNIGSFATDTSSNGWILQSYVSKAVADGIGKIGGRNYLTGKTYGLDFNGATGTVLSGNVNVTLANEQVQDGLLNASYQYGMFASSAGVVNYVRSDTLEYQPGLKWTSRTSTADYNWRTITYGNRLFVAIDSDNPTNKVMTSSDGVNWTSSSAAAANTWNDVAYGNGLFVAVSSTGTGNRVMTSTDGVTWTSRSAAVDNSWFGVAYGNGLFVAVSQSGTGNRVMTSTDGVTWTSRTSAADNSWNDVAYGNGVFVATSQTGTGNRVMTSGIQDLNTPPNNNIFQGDYTFAAYPNTRNDAGNPINVITTSAAGVIESHPVSEVTNGITFLKDSRTYNFPSCPAGGAVFVNFTITGATQGAAGVAGLDQSLGNDSFLTVTVGAAGLVTVALRNMGLVAFDAPSGTLKTVINNF